MKSGLKAGRVFGIEIHLHASLVVVFTLISISLGLGILPLWHPDWPSPLIWAVALGAAVLFFASVLLHELGHALAARTQGIPTHDITLFLFGGAANVERDPRSPRAEFLIAIAGPAVSVALGLAFSAAAALIARHEHLGPLRTLFAWLGPINLLLAGFNMLPGYPLDGGRVLRALLWATLGDLIKATRWASRVGRALGWTFIALGLAMTLGVYVPLLGQGPIAGLWMALIGAFLDRVSRASFQQVLVQRSLEHVPVASLMTRDPVTVAPHTSVEELVAHYVLRTEQHTFPVVAPHDRTVLGIVDLEDVRRVPRDAWPATPVASIMTPLAELPIEHPDTEAYEAMRDLARQDRRDLPVIENGQLRGLIERDHVLRWVEGQLRRERGA